MEIPPSFTTVKSQSPKEALTLKDVFGEGLVPKKREPKSAISFISYQNDTTKPKG
jgi:hypothetical protein